MPLIENLTWRYATKKYDATKKVSKENVKIIVEAARLAPSSYGIQPYKIIAISNQKLKDKIYEVAWKQQMIKDCSHVLVFAAWDKYTEERVEYVFNYITEERDQLRGNAFGSHTDTIAASQYQMSEEAAFVDTSKQACISLGLAVAQAAELRVDNTPMGGFYNDQLDSLLELRDKGLKSVYMLAIGYRSEEGDWLVNLKKVRSPEEEFLIELD